MDNSSINKEKIAIIGGTGKEGRGLAFRWAKAGYPVVIGSRNREKAETARDTVIELLKSSEIEDYSLEADENENAVRNCDIAVLTIPYEFHDEMLLQFKGFTPGEIPG